MGIRANRVCMRYRFTLRGSDYSKHKNTFKNILARHGLKWRGSLDDPWWGGEGEEVHAVFERDEERDLTISATLIWEGRKKSELLEELRSWVWELGGEGEQVEAPVEAAGQRKRTLDTELKFWEIITRPNVEYMRKRGRPKKWIERDLEDWERRRRKKKRELSAKTSAVTT